ncbi:MAG TPA: hypothetical protein VGN80_05175 [Devosiaceae bacterium]|jgi:hypothetical protein|nr:hypothetical protein [Devosiaceae bacterium]
MNTLSALAAPALLAGLLAFAGPSVAQSTAPDAFTREALIRSTLLTFNDANMTGIYDVLRARSSTPFQETYTAEQLAETFKVFRDQQIDLMVVAAMDPVEAGEPVFNEDGVMTLTGHFETQPQQIKYEVELLLEAGGWKMIGINVNIE